MDLSLRMCLPREEVSIPLTRRILGRALDVLGVDPDCRSDIEIAITEACTNVLEHARSDEREYVVTCTVADDTCVLRVVDTGGGFDPALVPSATDSAESGRGLHLMNALVDDVRFETRREEGTVVILEKSLVFVPDAPAALLRDDRPA